ncbi:MAG: hypothetical protein ACYTEK_27915 [Planctomycetota bacterium]
MPWPGASQAMPYALAWRITGDAFMWEMARNIGRGNNFGDIGATSDAEPQLKINSNCSDYPALLGFLELHRKTGKTTYLTMAKTIGDNILAARFHEGFFVNTRKDIYVKFDAVEPLVLLHLHCALEGKPASVPTVWPGRSYFHCPFDGKGRTYDNAAIYSQKLP